MVRINLLSWREELRAYKNKIFLRQLWSIFFINIIVCFLVWFLFHRQLMMQNQSNEQLIQNTEKLATDVATFNELVLQKRVLEARLKLVHGKQSIRGLPLDLWQLITRSIPSNIFLDQISREGDVLILSGEANHAKDISNLIQKLEDSIVLSNITLKTIQRHTEEAQKKNGLKFKIVSNINVKSKINHKTDNQAKNTKMVENKSKTVIIKPEKGEVND